MLWFSTEFFQIKKDHVDPINLGLEWRLRPPAGDGQASAPLCLINELLLACYHAFLDASTLPCLDTQKVHFCLGQWSGFTASTISSDQWTNPAEIRHRVHFCTPLQNLIRITLLFSEEEYNRCELLFMLTMNPDSIVVYSANEPSALPVWSHTSVFTLLDLDLKIKILVFIWKLVLCQIGQRRHDSDRIQN